jgi:protein-S-isoprenylcysteine O-methyltransferase Ste14
MTANATSSSSRKRASGRSQILRLIIGIPVAVGFVVCFFWAAGSWSWRPGWVFFGLFLMTQIVGGGYLKRTNPEMIKGRGELGELGEGTPGWDKAWLGLFGVFYVSVWIVAALDAGRFLWAPLPLWVWPIGLAAFVLGNVIGIWAMRVNTHFEKTVRIQHDRDHQVIDSGPYRIVRHPGYVGIVFAHIVAPALLLGSAWAFVPVAVTTIWIAVRTFLEDRLLQRELDGYRDYASRVHSRLIPGIW